MSTVLPDLRYSAEHEWIDDSSPARIGITAVASEALGDVVYVDLPEVGAEITADSTVGEVESTKSVSDLFAPLTGTVTARNEALAGSPELVNSDPYGEGWLVAITPDDPAEVASLLDAAAYRSTLV